MTNTEDKATDNTCAHGACDCKAAEVVQDGQSFCSEGCAAGVGCSHRDCNCGSLN